jgi:hypothetical protein
VAPVFGLDKPLLLQPEQVLAGADARHPERFPERRRGLGTLALQQEEDSILASFRHRAD